MNKDKRKRLKELKKLDKQNALSLEETWEYINLLNEETDRTWKQTEKLQRVAFIFLGLSVVMEAIAIIVAVLKHLISFF